MLLAQGRFWRASLNKGAGSISIELFKASLPEDLYDLKDMKIEVPIGKWNLAVKHVHSDRKLLGGLLLDFANNKERVSAAVGNDRLLVLRPGFAGFAHDLQAGFVELGEER